MPEQKGSGKDLAHHVRNFVDCIKSRSKPTCDVETARNIAVNSHLGNIALRTGRKIYWDDTANTFINDAQANDFTKPSYRAPWKLPVI